MKNVTMSGQKISVRSKIKSAFDIYQAHKSKIFSDAKSAVSYHKDLVKYLQVYTGLEPRNARILDVGCGQTATQTLLFHADGAKVTGIDIEVPTYKMSPSLFFKVIKLNGIERALKSLSRHILFDKNFFIELSREYGKEVSFEKVDIRIMDAKSLAFDPSCFDLIFSTTVFEHIDDVPAAVKEIDRVLKPSGAAVIFVHLFPSISGGHCLEWIFPDKFSSSEVPPWDHLRDNKYPANAYMNRLTISRYREIFRSNVEIIKEETVRDGERFLSKELELELNKNGFSKEDLLTRSVTFFIRKKRNVN